MSDNIHHLTPATQTNRQRLVYVCNCGYSSNTLEVQGADVVVCCTNCGRESAAADFDVRLSQGLLAEKTANASPAHGAVTPKADEINTTAGDPARITLLQRALKAALRCAEAEGPEAVAIVAVAMATGAVRVSTAEVEGHEQADWMRKRCSDIVGLIEDICADFSAPEVSDDQGR